MDSSPLTTASASNATGAVRSDTLGRRMVFGSCAVGLFVLVFLADAWLARIGEERSGLWGMVLRSGTAVPLLWGLMIVLGMAELTHLARARSLSPLVGLAVVVALLFALTPWLTAAGLLGTMPFRGWRPEDWERVWWGLLAIGLGMELVRREDPRGAIGDVGVTVLMVFLLGVLPGYGLRIRCAETLSADEGTQLLFVVL
ncbi:MAG: hypothetical protein D6788_10450, partial [Planctomycetota bacterium]